LLAVAARPHLGRAFLSSSPSLNTIPNEVYMWDYLRSQLRERKSEPSGQRGAQLALEALEERAVPAVLDLTTPGATQTDDNGAIFKQVSTQPTGTGVIHSFVRIQPGGNVAVGQGYNTDARPLQFDENKSPVFTRSLKMDEVPQVLGDDGVLYREFLLDINQKASSPLLSLDELRIYRGSAPDLKGYDAGSHELTGAIKVYDLDANTDNMVKLNARLNHGSGSGDMVLLVPDAAFQSAPGDYVYLYSKFGATIASNGGFEEWAVRSSDITTPQASLSGVVYFDNNQNGTVDTGEGLGSFLVTLTFQDQNKNTVTFQQWTDASGHYDFGGLPPGAYSIAVQLTNDQQQTYLPPQDITVTATAGLDQTQLNFSLTLVDNNPLPA
jgi:hypothetical protein